MYRPLKPITVPYSFPPVVTIIRTSFLGYQFQIFENFDLKSNWCATLSSQPELVRFHLQASGPWVLFDLFINLNELKKSVTFANIEIKLLKWSFLHCPKCSGIVHRTIHCLDLPYFVRNNNFRVLSSNLSIMVIRVFFFLYTVYTRI